MLSLGQACVINGTGTQALYVAIKKGRLKATKREDSNRYEIRKKDLTDYMKLKYDRADAQFKGEPKYDKRKGEYSIKQAAAYLEVSPNLLYYLMRIGKVSYTKKGCSYVLNIDEIHRIENILVEP